MFVLSHFIFFIFNRCYLFYLFVLHIFYFLVFIFYFLFFSVGIAEERERNALALSTYKKSLEKSESLLLQSKQEIITLEARLKVILEGSRRNSNAYAVVGLGSVEKGNNGNGNNGNSSNLSSSSNINSINKKDRSENNFDINDRKEKQLLLYKNQIQTLTEQLEQIAQSKRYARYSPVYFVVTTNCSDLYFIGH